MTRQEKIKAAEEGIKELKSNIDDWEENNDCLFNFKSLILQKPILSLIPKIGRSK